MPIQVPLFLVNQTGPEWAKFEQQALKAGFDLKDIGNVGREVFDDLVKRKLQESSHAVGKLADTFGTVEKSARGAGGAARDLAIAVNSTNIAYGHERQIYNLARMVDAIGLWAVPLGAVAGAVGLVAMGIKELQATGAPALRELTTTTEGLSSAWHNALLEVGHTDAGTAGITAMTAAARLARDSVEGLSYSTIVAVAKMKEVWNTLTNQVSDYDATFRGVETAMKRSYGPEHMPGDPATAASVREKAMRATDAIRAADEKRERAARVAKIDDKGELDRQINEQNMKLQMLERYSATGRDDKAGSHMVDEAKAEHDALTARKREIEKEEAKLAEHAAQLEKERLAKDRSDPFKKPTEIRHSDDAKRDLEEQEKVLKSTTATLKEKREADEKIKGLQKEIADLTRSEARDAERAVALKNQQLAEQRKLNLEIARENQMKEEAAKREQERLALKKQQEFEKRMTGGMGGDEGVREFVAGADKNKVRDAILRKRMTPAMAALEEKQAKELAEFDRNAAPDLFEDVERRRAIVARQKSDRARLLRSTRARTNRDFNRGNIQEGEMLQAQSEVMKGVVDQSRQAGRVTGQTAQLMGRLIDANQQQQEDNRHMSEQLRALGMRINAQDQSRRSNRRGAAALNN